jgi:outer membrane immunogenic protein
MKKILLASAVAIAFCAPAFAADMPVKGPVYKAAPAALSWTGCYIGANVGGGWAHDENFDLSLNPPSLGSHQASGVMGGGQVGCDYQAGQFVFGLRGLFDWSHLTGQNTIPQNAAVAFSTKITSFDSATGRVGYAYAPNGIIYAQGGGAWMSDTYHQFLNGAIRATESQTFNGWTVGGGVEYLISRNWSWFAEYNYADFGRSKTSCFTGACNFQQQQHLSTVLVGINYRFGDWGKGPVSAKY